MTQTLLILPKNINFKHNLYLKKINYLLKIVHKLFIKKDKKCQSHIE
jgi:hypothetical protein